MEGPDSTPATDPQTHPLAIDHLSGLEVVVEFYQRDDTPDSPVVEVVESMDSERAGHTPQSTRRPTSGPSSSD